MAAEVHIFGIRHHGPGSARRLVAALDALQPAAVLIEGPADLSDLAPMLADEAMEPPVALLAYAKDDPAQASFWPFAEFSPERQAVLWAVAHQAALKFIDLPASWRLARLAEARAAPPPGEDAPEDDGEADAQAGEAEAGEADDEAEKAADDAAGDERTSRLRHDPIGALARAAGYEDGESWWSDVIEENPEPGPIFAAVETAMTALREAAEHDAPEEDEEELAREAHMRLEIAKAKKEAAGPVAVICGAWHAPALKAKITAKDDRARLKGAPKAKIVATWAPWTARRLASGAGYGAGVPAPGWSLHLWRAPPEKAASIWMARIAAALRAQGHIVSTASLIEAERLAKTLAAINGRPAAGFEELRDASIACLCFGEPLLWREIAEPLLIGSDVGAIPADAPAAPLLDDLQRQQKAARLKPEALASELSVDLRSESGLLRSTLLHRLTILGAPWGRLIDAGSSRGTFRERWVLEWKPEFAVQLVENLIFGTTIESAAGGRVRAQLKEQQSIGALAELVRAAITAQLKDAAEAGVDALAHAAADTSDCLELLRALPPLADVVRYGQARATDPAPLRALAVRLMVQAAIALPYAARGLDDAAARGLRDAVRAAEAAASLIEATAEEREGWRAALQTVVRDDQAARLVSGAAARLLYEAEALDAEEATRLLERMLSPGAAPVDAAGFFEGFFEGAGQLLIYDDALRGAVAGWVSTLEEDGFIEHLPLFRRVLSGLDRAERRQLLDRLFGRAAQAVSGVTPAPDGGAGWARHFAVLEAVLTGAAKEERAE